MLSQCFYSYTRHPSFLTGRRHDAADDTYWTTLTTEVIYVIVDAYFQVMWWANSHQKFFSEFIGKPLCGVEYLWHSTRKLRINDIIGSHPKQLTQRGHEHGEFLTGNLLMLIMAGNIDSCKGHSVSNLGGKRTHHIMTKQSACNFVYVEHWALLFMLMRWLTIIPEARVRSEMRESQRGSWNTRIALSNDTVLYNMRYMFTVWVSNCYIGN